MLAWSAARFPVKDLLRTTDLPRVSGSDCGTSTYVLVRPDKLDQQAVVEPVVPRLTADKWRINSTSPLRAEYRAPSRRRVLGSSYGRPLAAISDHPASRLRHMTRSHQRSRGRPSRAARSASRITSDHAATRREAEEQTAANDRATEKAHEPVACRAEPVFQACSSPAPDLAC